MEAYCNYEICKLLKEKGFNEPCMAFWDYELSEYSLHISSEFPINNSELEKKKEFKGFSAPTHQMARAWLRDIYNIDIDIDSEVDMSGRRVYVPSISTYKPIENTDTDIFRQLKRCLYYDDNNGFIPAVKYFHSYEEAVEASLKHVIEKLILLIRL